MSVNTTKIEWTDRSWNPITGCENSCPYCYARKITTRFPKSFPAGFSPYFYPERLIDPYRVRGRKRIFTCSMSDFFGPWNEAWWQEHILKVMGENPQHHFQVLTKCPENIPNVATMYPSNMWIGTTVTGKEPADRIRNRIDAVSRTNKSFNAYGVRFISFEPLLGDPDTTGDLDFFGLDWVIIGQQTNPSVKAEKVWLQHILAEAARSDIPVFMKNNLRTTMAEYGFGFRQEFPVCRV